MSTRSCIARATGQEGEFAGRYHHWDGMPTSLGKTLWDTLHGHFQGDLPAMLRVLIDEHPAGWSTIVGKDFQLKPGYTWQNVKYPTATGGLSDAQYKVVRAKYDAHPDVARPQCFCHGKRSEPENLYTHESIKDGTDLEWLYVFDEEKNRLHVRDLGHGEEMTIELSEPEPFWAEIECGADFSRCVHYAWFHNLVPRDCNLSMQTYLGKRAFGMRDAVAVLVNGKRYTTTGNGGNSDYMRRLDGNPYPSGTWIATVKAPNGHRKDMPIGIVKNDDYVPYPGVSWVYPPTKDNPSETIVSNSGASQ